MSSLPPFRSAMALCVVALGGCAERAPSAQQVASAVEQRQASMFAMAAAMQVIGAQIQGDDLNRAEIARQAALLEKHGRQITKLFPAGTGPSASGETLAKPQVWMDSNGFARHARSLVNAAQALEQAARDGPSRALLPKAMDVDAQCIACHKTYRPD